MTFMDKKAVVEAVSQALREKLLSFESMLGELNAAIAEDTKSSAGDKFETSRAMAQQEIDKVQQQQAETKRQLALLTSLPMEETATVRAGSLVQTDKGIFFVGVPAGQLEIGGKTVVCISSASPLAQNMIGKSKNEAVSAGNTSQTILAVS